jgi:hypothetical protein
MKYNQIIIKLSEIMKMMNEGRFIQSYNTIKYLIKELKDIEQLGGVK